MGISFEKKVTTKVNCEDCIKIVSFCKSIEDKEYKKPTRKGKI